MAITAAVIRDWGTMCAAGALIEMPAERSRTTPRNGQQHFDMPPTDPLVVSLDEGCSSSADEIGNLERRRGHWSTSSPIVIPHLYQNRLAITAPLAHAQRLPPGGYVQTRKPEKLVIEPRSPVARLVVWENELFLRGSAQGGTPSKIKTM